MSETRHLSIWEATTKRSEYPRLEKALEVDVAVVGAGITGLTAALLLRRAGKRVALVEAHHVGAGTTGRTTAHLTCQYDQGYRQLSAAYGDDTCRHVAQSMNSAIDLVERLVKGSNVQCDFKRTSGYFYAEADQNSESLEQEYEVINRLGLFPVHLCDVVPLPFPISKAFEVKDQAQFHAMKYVLGLARLFCEEGGQLFEHSPVIDFDRGPSPVIETDHGKLKAQEVILATHTPLGRSPLHATVAPYRSYAMAFTLARGEPPKGLFWDTDEPYNYIRSHEGEQPCVIVGGKDVKTGHGGEEEAFSGLEEYVRQRFEVGRVLRRWSAQYYEPADHLPSIGREPLALHVHVGTGYSGDGMTFGTLAGYMLSEQLLDRETPFDDLYRPSRLPRQGIKRLLHENADVALELLKRWKPGSVDEERLDALGAGEGMVLKGPKVAAFRDEDGHLRKFSAVCPHLHCVVKWNSAQKTFDCPCHGSRFDTDGRVLEGPALAGLASIE